MNVSRSRNSFRRLTLAVTLGALVSLGWPALSKADTASEIRAEIVNASAHAKANLKDMDGSISSKGSLQFWSSGGLIQVVPGTSPVATYTSYGLTPKHIEVITLEEGKSAVAMYYSEGGYQEVGSEPIAHYMTRITEVYVKEGAKWKVRAAHYSPIAAGSGTRQTAVD